jgi:hypothetical protein
MPGAIRRVQTEKVNGDSDGNLHTSLGHRQSSSRRLHEILIIEDKSKAGSLSKFQEKWIIAYAGCPAVKVLVARPEDWAELLVIIKGKED